MPDVVAVVTDLFFQSRINTAARQSGHSVHYVRSLDELAESVPFGVAFVDLDADLDVDRAIETLHPGGTVVAFGPHVDTDRRKRARAAGADRVLAKSKFVTELPEILSAL